MVRGICKVSLKFLVNLTIITISLVISTKSELLPPEYGESPGKQLIESEPLVDIAISGRANINYRLPNNTVPLHYNIELSTNVHNGTRNFTGRVEILLTATEDTRTIVLHALRLEDFQATIKNAEQTNAVEYPMNWSYEPERHFLSLTPQSATISFNRGTKWTLTIAYKGQLNTGTTGFHMLSYTDSSNKIHYFATTQFESTHARTAFPCYDEPAKRATFTITMQHHPSYNAISNMPKNESASSNGVTVFHKTNVTVSTYLIAFHVSDYTATEGAVNSIPHQLYSKPEDLGIHEFGLVSGILILQRLADYYKVPFALPKMTQVAIPGKGGAMENWGLVTYGERHLLFNKSTSTTSTQVGIANIIGHEFTHQWFGNHVAVRWWTYLWLKEGFAQLFSYESVDAAYPEWNVYQTLHTDDYEPALSRDGRGSVVPMTHYAQTPAEISARYDTSSYGKPACVIYMWQHALGDEVFRSSLNKYLSDNAFSSAEEWQLFAAMQSAVDEHKHSIPARIDVMFPTWSQQTGYPLLTVSRNYASKTFTVTQTAYHDNKTIASSKTYYVPFNYATPTKADFRDTKATHYLLNTKEITIGDSELGADDWLILNKQSTGYYRINYDDKNWRLIAQGLVERPNRIHPRNRAQLLYDAYKFVTNERLDHSLLLELLTYLPGEDQYAPWYAAYTIITSYHAYLNGDNEYNEFRQFVASLVSNIYETLGVDEVPGEQLLRKFTRNRAVNLACLVGVEHCLIDANDKLRTLINKGVDIEPNLKTQSYCNGLRKSSDNDYNYFFNDFLRTSDTTYRTNLRSALGCSHNEAQLKSFVSSTINLSNSLTNSERTNLLSAVYSRSALGLLVSIDFLSNNWEAYGKLSTRTGGSNPLSIAILDMGHYVTNNDQEKKLLDLVDKVKTSSMVDSNLEPEVKLNIKANFDWLRKNRAPIMSFVKRYRSNASATVNATFLSVFMALTLTVSRYL